MHKLIYRISCLVLFTGGLAHAKFVANLDVWKWWTDEWHFWQIAPICLMVAGAFLLGGVMTWRWTQQFHNKFGYIGRILAGLACLGLGYITGLEAF